MTELVCCDFKVCALMTNYVLWLGAMNLSRIPFCYLENRNDNARFTCISEEIMTCIGIVEMSVRDTGSGESSATHS